MPRESRCVTALVLALPIACITACITACTNGVAGGEFETMAASHSGGLSDTTSSRPGTTSSSTGPVTATTGPHSGSTSTGGTDSSGGFQFDLGRVPDMGSPPATIPLTCDEAAMAHSTVGCEFFGADLDQHDQSVQFAIVVSNVQEDTEASVVVEQRIRGMWTAIEGPLNIGALDLQIFELPNAQLEGSGVLEGGSYRVTADVPVVAYQFNPLDNSSYSSDASMLLPTTSWDDRYEAVQWPYGSGHAYITVLAATDDTVVTLRPSAATDAGPGVAAGEPGVPMQVTLQAGDQVELAATDVDVGLTGTHITADHPIAVFAGHQCGWLPDDSTACDHLEEQHVGVGQWGKRFAAGRLPVRNNQTPEPSVWQLYATADGTTITFEADPAIEGLPDAPLVLDAGQTETLWVTGPVETPGDFFVSADKPITLVNYMIGWWESGVGTGDPAMIQHAPVEQFLPRYVVLVPPTWDTDVLTLVRPIGEEIRLDGSVVLDPFVPIGDDYEVARVVVEDGVHRLDGDAPFAVTVVGFSLADSYGYLGGAGTAVINPAG